MVAGWPRRRESGLCRRAVPTQSARLARNVQEEERTLGADIVGRGRLGASLGAHKRLKLAARVDSGMNLSPARPQLKRDPLGGAVEIPVHRCQYPRGNHMRALSGLLVVITLATPTSAAAQWTNSVSKDEMTNEQVVSA